LSRDFAHVASAPPHLVSRRKTARPRAARGHGLDVNLTVMHDLPSTAFSTIRYQVAKVFCFIAAYYLGIAGGVSLAKGKLEIGTSIFAYAIGVPVSAFMGGIFFVFVIFYFAFLVWYLRAEHGIWLLVIFAAPLVWHAYMLAAMLEP
jgi:hypothetical protein